MPVSKFSFADIKGLLFDLDGVLYVGEELIEGAVEAVGYIKSKIDKLQSALAKSLKALNLMMIKMMIKKKMKRTKAPKRG